MHAQGSLARQVRVEPEGRVEPEIRFAGLCTSSAARRQVRRALAAASRGRLRSTWPNRRCPCPRAPMRSSPSGNTESFHSSRESLRVRRRNPLKRSSRRLGAEEARYRSSRGRHGSAQAAPSACPIILRLFCSGARAAQPCGSPRVPDLSDHGVTLTGEDPLVMPFEPRWGDSLALDIASMTGTLRAHQ